MAQFPIKDGLLQGPLNGTPSGGTVDLSAVTFTATTLLQPNFLIFDDHFTHGQNSDGDIGVGWRLYHYVGTGSTAGLVSSSTGSGLFNIISGSTSGNITAITTGLSGGTSVNNPCANDFAMAFRFGLSSSSNVAAVVGLVGDASALSATATITNGIYIRANTGTDTNWTFCCTSGGVTTATASSVAISTSMTSFSIRRVSASSVAFSINGGAETTISTNVPTGAMSPKMQIGTLTSATRTITADYFKLVVKTQ